MDNTTTGGQPETPEGARPGETITPGSPAPAATPTDTAAQPSPPQTPENASKSTGPAQAEAISEFDSPQPDHNQPAENAISWTAAEFIAHSKSASWYGLLALAVLALAAVVFLLTKDKISTGVVIVAGIALGAYGARQPQQRQYTLDEQGLSIGDKFLPYSLFRSFSVIDEGHVSSISFFPLKRFGQLTTIYYEPEDEEDIIGLLADRLPMDDRSHDAVDRLMKRIRF